MTAIARLKYFPSLHGKDPFAVKIFKFVFELITKLLVNWWALILIWLGGKTHQKWFVTSIKQLPNAMSFFRIIVTPYVMYQLIASIRAGNHGGASLWLMVMIAVIALDALDGPCARDLDAVSEFGARLDPASDKFCFAFIVLSYCVASWFEYSWAFCLVAIGLAVWCLHVELKLIRLAIGPFRKLLDSLKTFDPEFCDPGAHTFGKIKFNLQMLACIVGWSGLVFFASDPTAILVMTIVLFAARHFGDKSLGWHRNEYAWLFVVNFILLECKRRPELSLLQSQPRQDNVIPIRKTG